MSHTRNDYDAAAGLGFILAFLFIVISIAISGCAAAPSRLSSQSWDQANLKLNDHGCPTAIFIAPEGNLTLCEQPTAIQLPPSFNTLEQAAIAGLKAVAAEPTAAYYEWGGVIVQLPDGKFMPLHASTNFHGDNVEIRGDDFMVTGKVVSDYHTHPCLPEHYVEYFSPPDLIEPIFLHMTVFMGDFCTGNVHEFKAGDKPDAEHPIGNGDKVLYLTKGRIVGQFTTPHAVTVAG